MIIRIYTCPEWGARKPKQGIQTVGQASRYIMHHTAGHHAEISVPSNESVQEAMRYARDIQNFHMDGNGWIDSGHNFLVCRNGMILQGRWITVSAIEAGHMVDSAHCPGQNQQIGVEHEHQGDEPMTDAQRQASATLLAWCSEQYGLKSPLPVHPHREYYATQCPANLVDDMPRISAIAAKLMKGV